MVLWTKQNGSLTMETSKKIITLSEIILVFTTKIFFKKTASSDSMTNANTTHTGATQCG